jgi:hypothetical protein
MKNKIKMKRAEDEPQVRNGVEVLLQWVQLRKPWKRRQRRVSGRSGVDASGSGAEGKRKQSGVSLTVRT